MGIKKKRPTCQLQVMTQLTAETGMFLLVILSIEDLEGFESVT